MSEVELKPCPFCGGTNLRIMGGIGKYVRCSDCDASCGHLPGDGCNADEWHAAEAWNTRWHEQKEYLCGAAAWQAGECLGYARFDGEPLEMCKQCDISAAFEGGSE